MRPKPHGVILSAAKDLFVCAAVLLAGASRAQAQEPGTNLQVYLMTMGPGADIYERFGHNAIWVRDTVAHTDIVYNYGTFDFGGHRIVDLLAFGARFAMGPQRYWLGTMNLENTLRLYTMVGRRLTAQELNLTPAERADIASRLAVNALEENKYYAYDYFRDNCSTRVRDLLDRELEGALKRATAGRPGEGTLRFHTRRSITNDQLLFFLIDAAFGPRVDRPLDQWNEMFLPEKVQQRVREVAVTGPTGDPLPLVKQEFTLLDLDIHHVASAPPQWGTRLFLIGLVIAVLIALAAAPGRIALVGRIVGGAWLLATGIAGLALAFLWFITAHVATYANWNLFLLSPLALGLVPAFWHRANRSPPAWTPPLALVLAGCVLGVIAARLVGFARQDISVVAAMTALPSVVAYLVVFGKSKREIGPSRF